jgi:hypothetical protein
MKQIPERKQWRNLSVIVFCSFIIKHLITAFQNGKEDREMQNQIYVIIELGMRNKHRGLSPRANYTDRATVA